MTKNVRGRGGVKRGKEGTKAVEKCKGRHGCRDGGEGKEAVDEVR